MDAILRLHKVGGIERPLNIDCIMARLVQGDGLSNSKWIRYDDLEGAIWMLKCLHVRQE